jgi:hypothetical protein
MSVRRQRSRPTRCFTLPATRTNGASAIHDAFLLILASFFRAPLRPINATPNVGFSRATPRHLGLQFKKLEGEDDIYGLEYCALAVNPTELAGL